MSEISSSGVVALIILGVGVYVIASLRIVEAVVRRRRRQSSEDDISDIHGAR